MTKIDLVMVVYRICIMYRNVGHSDTCERAHHSVMLIYVPVLCDLPYSNPFEDVELQISRYLSNLRFLPYVIITGMSIMLGRLGFVSISDPFVCWQNAGVRLC